MKMVPKRAGMAILILTKLSLTKTVVKKTLTKTVIRDQKKKHFIITKEPICFKDLIINIYAFKKEPQNT